MDRPELRLAPSPPARPRAPGAAAAGVFVLAAAAWASLAGADRARTPFDPAPIAENGLSAWLDGNDGDASAARAALRRRLDRTPTDAMTRTIYASFLVETATTEHERRAAAEEGRRAVASAPYEEGVRRASAKVMARTGDQAGAVAAVRSLFADAPEHAALVLSEIEPFLTAEAVEASLPDLPAAWYARSGRLRQSGRAPEADRLLAALLERWPDDLRARLLAGQIAAGRGEADALSRLVPPDLAVPEDRAHAALLALRARTRAAAGDGAGARRDAARASALAPDNPWVVTASGDALEGIDTDAARSYWTRALYLHGREESARGARVSTLCRLARLDEREGRAVSALRRWRQVLDLDRAHREAARRVDAIAGGAWPPDRPPR